MKQELLRAETPSRIRIWTVSSPRSGLRRRRSTSLRPPGDTSVPSDSASELAGRQALSRKSEFLVRFTKQHCLNSPHGLLKSWKEAPSDRSELVGTSVWQTLANSTMTARQSPAVVGQTVGCLCWPRTTLLRRRCFGASRFLPVAP
jgi:hypothetical protein